ncbi:hypothetical protein F8S13_16315 [Chloroflexia bacterium SDU3-3]|nr:hypothetical protein F8S13_16315 [Chloroflexia bacterium SDU3-3]
MISTRTMVGVLAALLLPLLLAAAPAQAQQPGIRLDATLGYEGMYRPSTWTPISITASNSGTNAQGTIEWKAANSSAVFSQQIDLPNGSQKHLALNVQLPSSTRSGTLSFISGGTTLAQITLRADELDSDQLLVAVASSDSGLLNSLSGMTGSRFASARVAHIALADIPEHAAALASVSALFVHDLDTSAITEAQRRALGAWASVGGQLVVSGGSGDTTVAAGLGDLMLVDLPGGYQQATLKPLASGAAQQAGLPDAATISNATPRQGSSPRYSSLVYTRSTGGGQLIFTAFDLAALRGWAGEAGFWGGLLENHRIQPIMQSIQQYNGTSSWFSLDSITMLPVWGLFCIFALYILALGPVNYLILRRLRRLELAWVTIPALAVLFVAGIYVGGRAMRGGTTQIFQVNIFQGGATMADGIETSYTGIFSPNRDSYTIGFDPQTLLVQSAGDDGFYGSTRISGQYLTDDTGMKLWNEVVDIGEMRTVVSERTAANPAQASGKLRMTDTSLSGSITYSGIELEDAMVVHSTGNAQQLGRLRPNETKTIQISSTSPSIQSISMSETSHVRRDQILQALPYQMMNQPTSAFLIGWQTTATIAPTINGSPSQPQGVTLYIIQLDTAGQ